MADKDSRNEALVLQASATEVRIIANRKGHSIIFGLLATGSGDCETFDEKKVVCHLRKVVSPYYGNTTNFASHLEHHHPAEYSAFLEESGRRTSASASASAGGSSSSTQATFQATLTHSQPLPKTSSHHKELVNAVGCFISKDLLLLSAVEGVGFHSLMELIEPRFTI